MVLKVYKALSRDLCRLYPELTEALRKDMIVLERMIKNRGSATFYVDLPTLGKLYDACLSSRNGIYLSDISIPHSLGGVKKKTLVFWNVLSHTVWFDKDCMTPIPNGDPGLVQATRNLLYLYKKVMVEAPQSIVDTAAWLFIRLDKNLRKPTLDWCKPINWRVSAKRTLRFADLSRVMHLSKYQKDLLSCLDNVCGRLALRREFDPLSIIPQHGPGAVSDLKSGQDKYVFDHWPQGLEGLYPYKWFTSSTGDLDPQEDFFSPDRSRGIARLCAVPKTPTDVRLISVEPLAHQYIQQGVLRWMREHMPPMIRRCYHPYSQEPSRQMALQASLRPEELSTVDLSKASDRLSLWVVERAIRNFSLLEGLAFCRSACIETPDRIHTLRKYAGQGNATTFPVQSMVYTMCCIAAMHYTFPGLSWRECTRKIQVFGDDIVVASEAVQPLFDILELLQLEVNVDKTHSDVGPFRESCGMDAYRGVEVTPLYMRSISPPEERVGAGKRWYDPSHVTSWVSVANNAYQKGFINLSKFMEESLPFQLRKGIPYAQEDPGSLYLQTFLAYSNSHLKWRFHQELHRWEALVWCAAMRERHVPTGGKRSLLQYFIEEPAPSINWCAGFSAGTSARIVRKWVPIER
jgi:hypothetical protein